MVKMFSQKTDIYDSTFTNGSSFIDTHSSKLNLTRYLPSSIISARNEFRH